MRLAYRSPTSEVHSARDDPGFALVEFLISTMILLILAAGVFSALAQLERLAGYQSEVQSVLDNTRIAMDIAVDYIQQAGNDPHQIGITGINIISDSEVRLQSDITGSAGPGSPDKGDPDGDIADSAESVTLRYNGAARTLELVQGGGSAQAIANGISGFSMRYYDASGAPTSIGSEARMVTVTISGASLLPDPETDRIYALQLVSNVRIATSP